MAFIQDAVVPVDLTRCVAVKHDIQELCKYNVLDEVTESRKYLKKSMSLSKSLSLSKSMSRVKMTIHQTLFNGLCSDCAWLMIFG